MVMSDVLQCKYKIFMKELRVSYLIHLSPLVPSLRLSDVQGATAVALEFSQFSINLSKVQCLDSRLF